MKTGIALSRQAISQHLEILESAKLIETKRQGKYKFIYLRTDPLKEIIFRWLSKETGGKL